MKLIISVIMKVHDNQITGIPLVISLYIVYILLYKISHLSTILVTSTIEPSV